MLLVDVSGGIIIWIDQLNNTVSANTTTNGTGYYTVEVSTGNYTGVARLDTNTSKAGDTLPHVEVT